MEGLSKRCCTCKEIKTLAEFYKDRSSKDGLEARCEVCRKQAVKSHQDKHPGRYSDYRSQWGKENMEACRIRERAYYQRNKETKCTKTKEWQKENKDYIQPFKNATHRKRRKEKPEIYRVYDSKKRAARLKRVPKWANLKAIAKFYKCRPKGMVVDHIVPLQGEIVSGLHVLENLQYLTPEENGRKWNKFEK